MIELFLKCTTQRSCFKFLSNLLNYIKFIRKSFYLNFIFMISVIAVLDQVIDRIELTPELIIFCFVAILSKAVIDTMFWDFILLFCSSFLIILTASDPFRYSMFSSVNIHLILPLSSFLTILSKSIPSDPSIIA
jgi:hypothetical protein